MNTPSTLMSHLIGFMFGLQSAVHPSIFLPVVLHWYRRHVADDEIWTTVRRTIRASKEDTTTKSWYVILVTIEVVRND